ncbi:MAG: hypothetical protein GXO75_00380 [Calditrichaeota bacterium]|nr:hypothetical protein [Calditrichota bacterium]
MSAIFGVLASVVSGLLNGSFAVPMKKTLKWEWENTWLIYALTAMIFYPVVMTLLFVPNLIGIYQQTPSNVLWWTFLFGVGWGIGSLMFGLGLHLVGLSLGYTIMIGVIAVAGALVPMLSHHPELLFTRGGLVIMMAMFIMVVGVIRCGLAGKIREQNSNQTNRTKKTEPSFAIGILICILAGVLSSMLNFAFYFGSPIINIAKIYLGASTTNFQLNHTVWFITLTGGFVPFLIYCGYLLIKNDSWRKYSEYRTGSYWFWAFLMGTLWTGAIVLYGISASSLGELGTTIGWLVLMAITVLVANIWGIFTGEWKNVPKKARIFMWQGLVLLIFSVLLVGWGKLLLI